MSDRDFLPSKIQNQLKSREDIANKDLRSRYALTFTIATSFFIICLLGLVGTMFYLTSVVYNKETNHTEKIISIVAPSVLFTIVLVMSVYYFMTIRNDLLRADKIATDISRITTAPMTDASFKSNLTNLVAGRLGATGTEAKTQIYKNIARTLLVDPRSYYQSNKDNIEGAINRDFNDFNRPSDKPNIIGTDNYN